MWSPRPWMTPALRIVWVIPEARTISSAAHFDAVVARRAVRPGAQEAEHHDPRDAGGASGIDDGLGAADVDRVVGLVADLAVDPRAVDDGVAAREARRRARRGRR